MNCGNFYISAQKSGRVKKLFCLWIWKIKLTISIRKVLGTKRALDKAFRRLGISMSFLPLSYNPLVVDSWFFQPWRALGKMTIIVYLSKTTKNDLSEIPGIWHITLFGKSKKGEMYVFCSTCEYDFSCARGGKGDCIQHVKSRSHLDSKFFTISVLLKSGLVRGMAIWEAGLIRGELLYTDLFRLTIYFLKKNNMFTKWAFSITCWLSSLNLLLNYVILSI